MNRIARELSGVGMNVIMFISIMVLGVALITVTQSQVLTIVSGMTGVNTTALNSTIITSNQLVNTIMQLSMLVVLAIMFSLALLYFLGVFGGRRK